MDTKVVWLHVLGFDISAVERTYSTMCGTRSSVSSRCPLGCSLVYQQHSTDEMESFLYFHLRYAHHIGEKNGN